MLEVESYPSPNFYDRKYPVDTLVLHATLGAFKGALQTLTKPKGVSAHFLFGREGEIAQLVDLDKAAWHAGVKSNMSKRAKNVIRRYPWGSFVNPNHQTVGYEFAAGYDIDRDGIIEGWEKLLSISQIKNAVRVTLEIVEPHFGITFDDAHIINHSDIASYKPNLETARGMFLTELNKQRNFPAPPPNLPTNPEVDRAKIVGEIKTLADKLV